MKLLALLKLPLGFLALFLAAVGVLVPVWPTTPFVLAAIACFSGTPLLQKKLLRIACFREYYESYTAGAAIRRQTVVGSLIFLWAMLMVSILLIGKLWTLLLLPAVGIAVTVHIVCLSHGKPKKKIMAEGNAGERETICAKVHGTYI